MVDSIDRYDTSLTRRIEEARSKIKLQEEVKGSEPIYRLEVPFDDKDYLKRLGEEAVAFGLVTGYTIETVETGYRWNGEVREGAMFILRTTIPDIGREKLRRISRFFYDGIGDKWEVPVIYIDSTIATNKEFVEWMKKQGKQNPILLKEPKIRQWKYVRNTSYINLFDEEEDENWEHSDAHILTLFAPRRHGIIDVEQAKAFFHLPIASIEARTNLYRHIRTGVGLNSVDRETLQRGKRELSVFLPEDW